MHESQYRTATWPPGVPKPGHPAWPDGAVRWIDDQLPHLRWRTNLLRDRPWILTVMAIAAVRAEIDTLREHYTLTANRWGRQLPPATTQKLLTATAREGKRLNVLLEELIALEEPLNEDMLRAKRTAGAPGDAAAGHSPSSPVSRTVTGP